MSKKWKYLLLSLGVIVISGCLFTWWVLTSITADDHYFLHRRDEPYQLATAFTIALRKNHPSAYQMIDPALTSRLDEWMNTHEVPGCARRQMDIIAGGGRRKGIGIAYWCTTRANRAYKLVLDVVIEDMKVTDWEVIAERSY